MILAALAAGIIIMCTANFRVPSIFVAELLETHRKMRYD